MEWGMLSLEDGAAIQTAIEICNKFEMKRTILCKFEDCDHKKAQWNAIVENKASSVLKNLRIPEQLQKKVMAIVPSVGMRMISWAEYHEKRIGFSRDYSIDFLKSYLFTQKLIIDNKRAEEEFMNDKNLTLLQKYKLACIHCFTDYIPFLYRQMTKEEQKELRITSSKGIDQFRLIWCWSCDMAEVDTIDDGLQILKDQDRLEKAIASGSNASVDYYLEIVTRRKNDAIVYAAVEAIKSKINYPVLLRMLSDISDDLPAKRYDEELLVPIDFHVDIMVSLLSKMREDQTIEFLKKDIDGTKYSYTDQHRQSRVLKYILNWPYQDYFMKVAKLMWEFLPEDNYAILLLRICDKIDSKKGNYLGYCEEKYYDYRGILKEFWCQSPERYKRFVFSDEEVYFNYKPNIKQIWKVFRSYTLQSSITLLIMLLTLNNFTHEDGKNIKLILSSATDEEKENLFSSDDWRHVCLVLMKEEEWEVLDRFALNCFSSEEEIHKFKRELIFSIHAQYICVGFIKEDKRNAAESAIKWSAVQEDEVNRLQREIFNLLQS